MLEPADVSVDSSLGRCRANPVLPARFPIVGSCGGGPTVWRVDALRNQDLRLKSRRVRWTRCGSIFQERHDRRLVSAVRCGLGKIDSFDKKYRIACARDDVRICGPASTSSSKAVQSPTSTLVPSTSRTAVTPFHYPCADERLTERAFSQYFLPLSHRCFPHVPRASYPDQ